VIIITLFGTTRGLELQHFPFGVNALHHRLEDAWIGITASQLNLRPEKNAVVVSRRSLENQLATWIGIYRPAIEMGYERPGGFYGAGAWIIDHVVDARLLIESLEEMANQIKDIAMQRNHFVKKISDARNEFSPPSRASVLLSTLAKVQQGLAAEGESAFIVEDLSYIEVIEWAQRARSASHYSKVFIGSATHIPMAGRSPTLKVFESLSLSIEGAYQGLSLKYRAVNERAYSLSQEVNRFQEEKTQLENDRNLSYEKLLRYTNDLRKSITYNEDLVRELKIQKEKNYLLQSRLNYFYGVTRNSQATENNEQSATGSSGLQGSTIEADPFSNDGNEEPHKTTKVVGFFSLEFLWVLLLLIILLVLIFILVKVFFSQSDSPLEKRTFSEPLHESSINDQSMKLRQIPEGKGAEKVPLIENENKTSIKDLINNGTKGKTN